MPLGGVDGKKKGTLATWHWERRKKRKNFSVVDRSEKTKLAEWGGFQKKKGGLRFHEKETVFLPI